MLRKLFVLGWLISVPASADNLSVSFQLSTNCKVTFNRELEEYNAPIHSFFEMMFDSKPLSELERQELIQIDVMPARRFRYSPIRRFSTPAGEKIQAMLRKASEIQDGAISLRTLSNLRNIEVIYPQALYIRLLGNPEAIEDIDLEHTRIVSVEARFDELSTREQAHEMNQKLLSDLLEGKTFEISRIEDAAPLLKFFQGILKTFKEYRDAGVFGRREAQRELQEETIAELERTIARLEKIVSLVSMP